MFIWLVGLVCKLIGLMGDRCRAALGACLVRTINKHKIAYIPSSAIFDPKNASNDILEIRAALDKPTEGGGRGGWKAANELISQKRKQAEPLLSLPIELATTILMGMDGPFAPVTKIDAENKINEIAIIYHKTSKPSYVYEMAHVEAVKLLKEADSQAGYLGTGCLKKLFEARSNPNLDLGENIREEAVLLFLQHHDEYGKFLGRDEKGRLRLPEGTSYEAFATSMLRNAYGEIPL